VDQGKPGRTLVTADLSLVGLNPREAQPHPSWREAAGRRMNPAECGNTAPLNDDDNDEQMSHMAVQRLCP